MTLDIRGSLKNTRKSKNPMVVIDELFANSIDAFLIRRDISGQDLTLAISLSVVAKPSDLLNEEWDLEITCADNGCGLGVDQLKAFLTKDTSYKDDLNISGIGNCKGSGRIQFFHHFSTISLSSVCESGEGKASIYLKPIEGRKVIEESDFIVEENALGELAQQFIFLAFCPRSEMRFSLKQT